MQNGDQLLVIDGLGQEVHCPSSNQRNDTIDIGMPKGDNDRQIRIDILMLA